MPKTCNPHHKQHGIAGNAFLLWQARDFRVWMKILIAQKATKMHCKNAIMSTYFNIKTQLLRYICDETANGFIAQTAATHDLSSNTLNNARWLLRLVTCSLDHGPDNAAPALKPRRRHICDDPRRESQGNLGRVSQQTKRKVHYVQPTTQEKQLSEIFVCPCWN
jgi:hypothetical protein